MTHQGEYMPYCFHCNKEVMDLHRCPECGRELLPDINFVDHEETHEEMFLREIRRKKLKEVREKEKKVSEKFVAIKERENSIPKNYTSVRSNPKYSKKE